MIVGVWVWYDPGTGNSICKGLEVKESSEKHILARAQKVCRRGRSCAQGSNPRKHRVPGVRENAKMILGYLPAGVITEPEGTRMNTGDPSGSC